MTLVSIRERAVRIHGAVAAALGLVSNPGRHWLVVYALLLPYFTIYRCVGLRSMLSVFATREERTRGRQATAIVVGALEDALLVTFLVALLGLVDAFLGPNHRHHRRARSHDCARRGGAPPRLEKAQSLDPSATMSSHEPATEPSTDEDARAAPQEPHQVQQSHEHATPDDDEEKRKKQQRRRTALRRIARALCHLTLVVLAMSIFTTDILLLRLRGMRFTFAFLSMFIREVKFVAGVHVDPAEVHLAQSTIIIAVSVAILVVMVAMLWLDLSRWSLMWLLPAKWNARFGYVNPTATTRCHHCAMTKDEDSPEQRGSALTGHSSDSTQSAERIVNLEKGECRTALLDVASPGAHDAPTSDVAYRNMEEAQPEPLGATAASTGEDQGRWSKAMVPHRIWGILVPLVLLFIPTLVLLVLTQHLEPVVAALALNDSLNEPLRLVTGIEFQPSLGDGTIESADLYLDSDTEEYTLFQKDVLYRKTTGFKGPKAFDITVDPAKPPNVVVVVVESFRYIDSMYMLGNNPALQAKRHNITLTPHFDRWAKRGLAFRNFWSSWQTSRSLESILFGQVPYDHNANTGTTGGRKAVKLQGMPQLFAQKGYETWFTTGTKLDYDTWNKFLPSHGFEHVWGTKDMKEVAESTKNISKKDWEPVAKGGKGRGLFWGVHDDLTFDILGDLLVNKTKAQRDAGAKPFFVNHYTISSHTPYNEAPEWFDKQKLADYSPLYEGFDERGSTLLRNHARMRIFEDLALGKFLDRMNQTGVLNDTIVVIVGDHGQSPEYGEGRPYDDQITVTKVAAAIIAEGRLGKHAGSVFDDAAAQYDLLNTLADIVGVPKDGFLQTSVGRSLMRAIAPGQRAIYPNNPLLNLAVVKGNRRLAFDRRFSMMSLYDPDKDPWEADDLFPTLSEAEKAVWRHHRDAGRRLNRYFKTRWDKACVTKVSC